MLQLAMVTLVVPDYDDGLAFFVGLLGFHVVEDTFVGTGKRWVVMAPEGGAASLLLAPAVTDEQRAHIGQQTGGRRPFFLQTDDFDAEHHRLIRAGVAFREAPRNEPYGRVVVFRDPFGNLWDLIGPRATEPAAPRKRACT